MLKLLLKLWWLQQRRNFHKRDAISAPKVDTQESFYAGI